MIKYTFPIVLIIACFLNIQDLLSQSITSSPYSMYGIGDIIPSGFGPSRAMGGTGIALSSGSGLNNINPASYHSIDSLYFLMEAGMDGRHSKYKSGYGNQTSNSLNFNYLALGFRIAPWWATSAGVAPFSSVGNNINTTKAFEGSNQKYNVNLEGTGGLNQYYWGNSFTILKKLYVGVNMAYLLGSVKQTESITSNYFKSTLSTIKKSTFSRLYLSYGLQYSFSVNKDVQATIGGIFANKQKLQQRNELAIYTNPTDTLDYQEDQQTSFALPLSYGVGVAIKYSNKVLLTGDYKFNQWSKTQPLQPEVSFVNSTTYSVGAEVLPSTSFRAPYFAKFKYRVGAYLNNNYLMIKGQQIRDMGISVGVGIPVSNKFRVNFSYQLGRKGTIKNSDFITENYQSLMLNVSFSDFWFIKPKFD